MYSEDGRKGGVVWARGINGRVVLGAVAGNIWQHRRSFSRPNADAGRVVILAPSPP